MGGIDGIRINRVVVPRFTPGASDGGADGRDTLGVVMEEDVGQGGGSEEEADGAVEVEG